MEVAFKKMRFIKKKNENKMATLDFQAKKAYKYCKLELKL